MANVLNSNSIYIDTTGEISNTEGVRVMYVIITANSANARLVLSDNASPTVLKLDVGAVTSGSTQVINLADAPIVFPNGINVTTATTVRATLVYRRQGVE